MGLNPFDGGLAVYWKFGVDGMSLGTFTSCEGLGMELLLEQREEGGNNFFVHQLPGRLKYSNITFSRPLSKHSETVARWFINIGNGSGVRRTNGQIVALSPEGIVIAQWGLMGILPVRWSGPKFQSGSDQAAIETVEIAHQGFFDAAKGELQMMVG
jgi:phage tail-like protein